jgi:hypothetical protein
MKDVLIRRRQVLLAISQIAMATTLISCGQGAEQELATAQGDTDLELLASVAYDLFPFPGLQADHYVHIGRNLLETNSTVIAEGLTQLRAASNSLPWKELDEFRRVAILAAMQDSAFFASVRAATIEVLYRSPELFALIGYGGSAIEQGGYLNRGFDEINWLPRE